MTKKKTTEEFIADARRVHGNKYCYDKVLYTGRSVKVSIFCGVHEEYFLQQPASHLQGTGCPLCDTSRCTTEQFITKAKALHGDTYDYSAVEYKGSFKRVTIICKTHGPFQQAPHVHIGTHLSGCRKCSDAKSSLLNRMTTEEFIYKAKKVHGDRYSYDNVKYANIQGKVDIYCGICDKLFSQKPNSHLTGSGCQTCAKGGFNKNKPSTMYIMSCGDMTKIGVTNTATEKRRRNISYTYGADFIVFREWSFKDGIHIRDVETLLLRQLRATYKMPKAKFNGSTECFIGLTPKVLEALVIEHLEK